VSDHIKRHYVEWSVVAAVLLAGAIWHCWPSLQATQTQDDLDFFASAIRRAPCELSIKERLLDRLDAIEDQINKGRLPDYARWLRHDKVIRELLNQGLRHDTGRLIERELQRVERGFTDEKQPTLERR
jgi:hypothetical protein